MKNSTHTTFKVRIFYGGKEINPSSLNNLAIDNKAVNRIINDIIERADLRSEETNNEIAA